METVVQPPCLPRNLTEVLVAKARDMKMLPDIAVKAIVIAEDPNADVSELVKVVAQDVKLTTDIVSLSNSSMFGSTRPILSLQNAITRVGFRQTRNMLLSASVAAMMKEMNWFEKDVREKLCRHSFMTASISSQLNRLLRMGLQGEEFTAGLIHDIGRTLLAVALPTQFRRFDLMEFDESIDLLSHELNILGTTHAEVGAWYLQRNCLPDELIDVARYHHAPEEAGRFKRLIALTAAADRLSNFCMTAAGVEDRSAAFANHDCSVCPNLELLEALGVEDAVDKTQRSVSQILESAWTESENMLK